MRPCARVVGVATVVMLFATLSACDRTDQVAEQQPAAQAQASAPVIADSKAVADESNGTNVEAVQDLYLDLMKLTLTDLVYENDPRTRLNLAGDVKFIESVLHALYLLLGDGIGSLALRCN